MSTVAAPGWPPALTWSLVVVVGAFLGSFLNVCISRLPQGESVVTPPSRCPRCRTPIRYYDNVPLLSFALLRGRCRSCREPISWRYPAVEALAAGAAVLTWARFGPGWTGARALALTLLLLAVAFTDLETLLIPDRLTLPGIALGLALRAYPLPAELGDGVLGALAAGGLLLLVRSAGRVAFGREAMGLGDVKLAAMMGAFLGLAPVLVALFLGVLVGGLTAAGLLALGQKHRGDYLPFGTFLALGGILAAFWGRPLLAWYLGP